MLKVSGQVLGVRELEGKRGKFYRHDVYDGGVLLKVYAGEAYERFEDVPVRVSTDKFGPVLWVV